MIRKTTQRRPQQVVPWITPKIFPDLEHPEARIRELFDHYEQWFTACDEVVLVVATGNGDHILDYRGPAGWGDTFDWARYNCYGGVGADPMAHNLDWLRRVREGGERSENPYSAGPMWILSEQTMTYQTLRRIYRCLREEAERRDLVLRLLEYLEPGPEFCRSEWKTERHPEAARGTADAGGTVATGVIDVCSTLHADDRSYAAYPDGVTAGTSTGDFVAAQTAAFVRDLELDGVFLGNQFGLLGFWHPDAAPEPTAERRAGIARFFHRLRQEMGTNLVYWMDTYWPAEVEMDRWAMSEDCYGALDAILISTFAVLVERTQIVPNLESRWRVADRLNARGQRAPAVLFALDFVDPWYAYRTYLDDRRTYDFQRRTYRDHGPRCDGTSFFANDTFGQFVMPGPLGQTASLVAGAVAGALAGS